MPFALLSATLIAAAPVHLLESAPPALVDPDVATWYGWEPLLVDATAGVLFYGATAFAQQLQPTAQGVVTIASILLYAGGGPLLHLGRGRPLTALVDLGLRAGLPVAGLVVGIVAGPLSGVYGQLAYPGFVLGFVAAVITD